MFYRTFFILLLFPLFLFAQTDSVKTTLSEVVVSATKTQTPYYAVGNSVSVITANEISQKQLNSVVDVLKEMPGLSVYQLGGPGMMAYVNMRGMNTNHTLVIIDGAEMNDPSSVSNAFDFSSLNTCDIERIEIVRGPQSTLYGSDAVAGVVNIFTKKGGVKPSYSFFGEGGSNGFYRGNLSVSGSQDFINYFISAGKTGSDGVSAADSKFGNNEKDGYANNTVTTNINFDFSNWFNINTLYKYTKFDTDLDQNEKLGDDPNFTFKSEEHIFKGSASLKLFDGKWDQQLTTTFVKRFSNSIDRIDESHQNTSSASHTDGKRIKLDWQNNLSFVPNNLITFGLETETEKANTNYYSESTWGPYESLFPRQSVTTTGLYLQDQINISSAFFTSLGVRYDDNEKFGGETTFRISPAYFISSTGTKIRTSYGTGFKAPSLYYLFDPLYGNPDLKPEKSKGFDFGVDQFLFNNNYRFSLTYFNMKLENMFGYDANYKTINIAKASSSGWEFSFSISKIYNFSFNANYTYTKTKDDYEGSADYDKPLIRRPSNRFFIAVNYEPVNDLNLGLQVRYTGKRDDKDFSNYTTVRVTLPDYTVADLSASYKILDYLRLNVRVENLFDKEYEDVLYYGTLGRSLYAGINFEL
jgi:vitamin B12 transporter